MGTSSCLPCLLAHLPTQVYIFVPVLLIYSLLILLCTCLQRHRMRTREGMRLATMQVSVVSKSESGHVMLSQLYTRMVQAKFTTRESEQATGVHEERASIMEMALERQVGVS